MLCHPGELGAAQAYVTGELDVDGDLDGALTHASRWPRSAGRRQAPDPGGASPQVLRAAAGLGALRAAAGTAGEPGAASRGGGTA